MKEPQPLANDTIIPIADASEVPRYTVHSPVTIKEPPKVAPWRSPSLGEHNDHVLEELGFSSAQIERRHIRGRVARPHKASGNPNSIANAKHPKLLKDCS